MSENTKVIEGDFIERLDADDPDLNAAFFKFVDALDQEANSGGSIGVYEVPTDDRGMARAKTLRKTKLFVVPVGACTLDDICDRVVKEFMSPGQSMTIQLLGTFEGRQGIRLNRLINLKKANVDPKSEEIGGIAGILKAMQEENARSRADMMRVIASMNERPQVDPLQLGLSLFEKFTGMVKAMQPAPVASPMGIPGVPAGSPMDQMLQMFTVMKAMREFFGEEKSKEGASAPAASESLGSILQSVRDIAVPLIAASNRQAAMTPRLAQHAANASPIPNATPENSAPTAEPIPAATAPAPVAPAPVAPLDQQPSSEAEMKLLNELAQLSPLLIDMAEKKTPTDQVAGMILQAMPNDAAYNDALYAFVRDDECVNRLALLNANVEPHREWFEQLRVAIAAEFEPDEPPKSADEMEDDFAPGKKS